MIPDKEFDPDKFVDRTHERAAFDELLELETDGRILAIGDEGDMGKTHLLEQLQYRCRSGNPRIPAAMVALDQLSTAQPLDLVQAIQQGLEDDYNLQFPTFQRLDRARLTGEFEVIQNW